MISSPGARPVAMAVTLSAVFASVVVAEDLSPPDAARLAFFETKIRPVLVEHCYACHSADAEELKAGLSVDRRESLLQGGDSGPAVEPGDPEGSLLLQALRYETFEMPPSGRLPAAVIADFEHWIRIGLPDPRSGEPAVASDESEIEQGRAHWSFQPVRRLEPPEVANAAWATGDIDRFLLAKLEQHALQPAGDADRASWLRRVTFALIGLPPTPEEIDAFLADTAADAYERVVDRLLASPHFGERWGRHWLDIARFAESSGGGRSLLFPDAWRYRDYVIEAVNQDKPLNQFITEQIAGDLLPHANAKEEHDHLVATGYLVLGAHNYEEQNKRALEMDVVDEQLDTMGRGLLGMTLTCARCHNHKFDPIPTTDYYALAGILRSTNMLVHENVSHWTTRRLPVSEADAAAIREYESQLAAAEQQLAAAKAAEQSAESADAATEIEKRLAALRKSGPPQPVAMAVEEAGLIEDCRICIRGSVAQRGPAVPRGVLQVATWGEPPQMPPDESGRRELAAWITSPHNPLTARVYVNRVWHQLFGAGLVRTLDNFGTTGEPPSHPELLDYLAGSFIENGWSTKRLIRRLALSHAYRMAVVENAAATAVDPENRLLWRMNRVRLDAESLRDAMLLVSGKLDRRIGGPNMQITRKAAEAATDQSTEYNYHFSDFRRSVYTPALRNRTHELFEVFDFADPNSAVARRNVTTVAPQALLMLNSPLVMELAQSAAERALTSGDLADEQRIERAFRETLGRRPTQTETAVVSASLNVNAPRNVEAAAVASGRGPADARLADWSQLFQGLFGCVDFRYIE